MDGKAQSEPPCCPWCTCARCRVLCLRLCCCCCYKQLMASDTSNKYPHILYGQLVQPQDSKQGVGREEPGYESPYQRRYKYPQKYREYSIPPQLEGQEGELSITQQPHRIGQVSPVPPGDYDWGDGNLPISEQPGHGGFEPAAVPPSEEGDGVRLSIREQPHRRGFPSPNLSTQFEEESIQTRSEISSLSDADIQYNLGVGFIDRGRRPSLAVIERSPDSTLKRGEHLRFPTERHKKMSINTLRPLDASLIEKLEALKPASTPIISGLYFSLYFDDQKDTLIAHMDRAINIPTQRPEQSSNPFLQIYLLPSKLDVQVSHSIDETHSPVFDRVFRFCHLPTEKLKEQLLVIRLYINTNHFVGGVLYSLADTDLVGDKVVEEIEEFDEEEGLRESFPGDILLRLCYHSRTDTVEVLILEVSNLKRHDILRQPNPYVKVNLLYHGRRVSKWKTITRKGTTNPIFNEVCPIDVSNMNIEDIQIDVVVMNYDRLGHNDEVGTVSFGDVVSHDSGLSHWKKIMIDTNTEVSRWHPLVPPASSIVSRTSSPVRTRKRSPRPMQGCLTAAGPKP